MSEIQRGALLQYRSEHYGKYYPKLPRAPYATDFKYMDSTYKANQEAWAAMVAGTLGTMTTSAAVANGNAAKKKFVIFCAKVVEVVHPRIPLARCFYLKCFISDPYVNNETIDGWVRDIWVEPLTELKTYGEEEKQAMREIYLRMKEHGPSETVSPIELFKKLKEQG